MLWHRIETASFGGKRIHQPRVVNAPTMSFVETSQTLSYTVFLSTVPYTYRDSLKAGQQILETRRRANEQEPVTSY